MHQDKSSFSLYLYMYHINIKSVMQIIILYTQSVDYTLHSMCKLVKATIWDGAE